MSIRHHLQCSVQAPLVRGCIAIGLLLIGGASLDESIADEENEFVQLTYGLKEGQRYVKTVRTNLKVTNVPDKLELSTTITHRWLVSVEQVSVTGTYTLKSVKLSAEYATHRNSKGKRVSSANYSAPADKGRGKLEPRLIAGLAFPIGDTVIEPVDRFGRSTVPGLSPLGSGQPHQLLPLPPAMRTGKSWETVGPMFSPDFIGAAPYTVTLDKASESGDTPQFSVSVPLVSELAKMTLRGKATWDRDSAMIRSMRIEGRRNIKDGLFGPVQKTIVIDHSTEWSKATDVAVDDEHKRALEFRHGLLDLGDSRSAFVDFISAAEQFQNLGVPTLALSKVTDALGIARRSNLGNDFESRALGLMAQCYQAIGDAKTTLKLQRELLANLLRDGAQPEEVIAAVRTGLGRTLIGLQESDEAEQVLRKATTAFAKSAPEHMVRADAERYLGYALMDQGKLALARQTFEEAQRIGKKNLPEEHPFHGILLEASASLEERDGDWRKAAEKYEDLLTVVGENDIPTLLHLHRILIRSHQPAKAALRAQKALESAQELPKGQQELAMADVLIAMAGSLHGAGRYFESESTCDEALRILAKQSDSDRILMTRARAWDGVGIASKSLGDPRQLFAFRRALEIRETLPPSLALAESHESVADCMVLVGEFAEARSHSEKALEVFATHLPPDAAKMIEAWTHHAKILTQIDEPKPARKTIDRVEDLLDCKGIPQDDRRRTDAVINSGLLAIREKNYDLAVQSFEHALKIDMLQLGPEHYLIMQSLSNLGRALWLRNSDRDRADALECFARSRQLTKKHVTGNLPKLSPRGQRYYLRTADRPQLSAYMSHILSSPNDRDAVHAGAEWLLNSKAIAHEIRARRERAISLLDDPGVKELFDLRERVAHLRFVSTEKEPLHRAVWQAEELEAQLGASLSFEPTPWVKLDDVRACLNKGEVLCEFVRTRRFDVEQPTQDAWTEDHYIVWIIPRIDDGPVRMLDLGPADRVDSAIDEVHENVEAALVILGDLDASRTIKDFERLEATYAPTLDALRQLAKLVVDPITAGDSNAEHLIVSPDGALWKTPWSALVTRSGKFLVEERLVTTTVSGRLLSGTRQKTEVGPPQFFADPHYDLAPAGQPPQSDAERLLPKVKPLKYAVATRKMKQAASQYSGLPVSVVEGSKATEDAFRSLNGPDLLLLMTHGKYLPLDPSDKYAPLTDDPLSRCFLCLAGMNNYEQSANGSDGVLTALEILMTNLKGTRVAILSACETGRGDVQLGEGVLGLQQCFQLAGAEATVSSLWSVPDRSTAQITEAFLESLAEGAPRGDALRQAQLKTIAHIRGESLSHGKAHPVYWAAFQLTGSHD